jgi:hypothetical protein
MIHKTVSLYKKLVGTDQSVSESIGVCKTVFSGQQELAQGFSALISISKIGAILMLWLGQHDAISRLINQGLCAFLMANILKFTESCQSMCVIAVHIHGVAVYDYLMICTKMCQAIM